MVKPKIAIIGAGFSAIILANKIKDFFDVKLFEKSRSVGGRMATRYSNSYQFDHGAQYFTARTPAFQEFTLNLQNQGLIQPWPARFVEIKNQKFSNHQDWSKILHYVALPKMNQLCKELSKNLDISCEIEVAKILKNQNKWQIFNKNNQNLGEFDWVICTAPAQQSTNLMPEEFIYSKQVKNTKMIGCFSLMVGLKEKIITNFDAAIVKDSVLSWIAINNSKPQRPDGFSILTNSTNNFAEENIEEDPEIIKKVLLDELLKILGFPTDLIDHISLHRWRYANIGKQNGEKSLFDSTNKLAACGDWCIQGRVESAFSSANDLAEKIIKNNAR